MIQCAPAIIITKIFVEHSILTGSNLYERLTKLINLELADMRVFYRQSPNIFRPIPNSPSRLLWPKVPPTSDLLHKEIFLPFIFSNMVVIVKVKVCLCQQNLLDWTKNILLQERERKAFKPRSEMSLINFLSTVRILFSLFIDDPNKVQSFNECLYVCLLEEKENSKRFL